MFWRKGFLWIFATTLLISTEINSQTYITPLIGMEIITIKSPGNYISGINFYDGFLGEPIPTLALAAGFDVERKIKRKLQLYYGFKYISFSSGYRRYHYSWGPDPYNKVSFRKISQKLGAKYYITPNVGVGLALNLDYIFDFKSKTKQTGSYPYYDDYSSLLDLGINFNLSYIWKNWVLKVDYNHGIHGLRKFSDETPPGEGRLMKPLKGFGAYAGYRFEF